jgi:hypothetical protein
MLLSDWAASDPQGHTPFERLIVISLVVVVALQPSLLTLLR